MDKAAIQRWATAFETLSPDTLDALIALADPNIRFKDPFNDVTGHAPLRAVFAEMFETCETPRFTIRDIAYGEKAAYIRWEFSFTPKVMRRRGPWVIEGMSEVTTSPDGRITSHIDHWDAATGILARLPGIGGLIRWILRRLAT